MSTQTAPTAFGVTHSFSNRRWMLCAASEESVGALARQAGISRTLARVMISRKIGGDAVRDHLDPSLKRLLPEPLGLKDMEKAVARAHRAIFARERIAVFGDYDVDGSCSAALLGDFLSALGASPRVYIPDRMREGYGPSASALLQLKEEGATLVVTVDCGAAAQTALAAAANAELDVVVLDHHAIEAAPPAFAQVNPNQPGDESGLSYLCAAGVVFLFVVALNRSLRESGWYAANGIAEPDLRQSLDLVGLATVCDVVPLVGVNRAYVRAALSRISSLSRPGFKALAEIAKAEPPFTVYHCGFVFGPRINAGGRIGRCSLGVELLTARTESNAALLAQTLDRHNRERQAIEAAISEEANGQAATQRDAPFLFACGDYWHSGVVGIVAGRLKERFGKAAFVTGFQNGAGRGSARSISGVDVGAMVRAALERGLLDSGGGHAMAAGFALPEAKLDAFRQFLAARFAATGGPLRANDELRIDGLISTSGATPALAEEIARAGPFGSGNPEPVLAAPDVSVAFADIVGSSHVRLRLEGADGSRLAAIAFRAASTPLGDGLLRARGHTIHVAGVLRAERWKGTTRMQLHVEDAAQAA